MKWLLLLALISTILSATLAFVDVESRIVGGNPAIQNQIPYIVSMRVKATNAHFCGGVIISEWWLISAAHCTINRNTDNTVVVAGSLNRITGGTPYDLALIINHEEYNPRTLENDICLLKTRNIIEITPSVRPIQMAPYETDGDQQVIISGWGFTEPRASTLALYLQYLQTTTVTNEECQNIATELGSSLPIPDSIVCTISRNGTSPCNADSGGPLTIAGRLLVGVLSFGLRPCNIGPNGYPRITYYRPWIEKHTGVY